MKLSMFLLLSLALYGCATPSDEVKKFAVVRVSSTGSMQVSIEGVRRDPLFTVHGFGGSRDVLFCWATLKGVGPEFRDPVLHTNMPFRQPTHTGVIVVDEKKRMVRISLQQDIPDSAKRGIGDYEPGAVSGPSPENGDYPIKRFAKEEFKWPEQ